jgi:hypothetical protein
MFMAAKDNQPGRYIRYTNIDSGVLLDVLDTQTGIMTVLTTKTGEGMSIDIINGKIRHQDSGEDWGEWKDMKDKK